MRNELHLVRQDKRKPVIS